MTIEEASASVTSRSLVCIQSVSCYHFNCILRKLIVHFEFFFRKSLCARDIINRNYTVKKELCGKGWSKMTCTRFSFICILCII